MYDSICTKYEWIIQNMTEFVLYTTGFVMFNYSSADYNYTELSSADWTELDKTVYCRMDGTRQNCGEQTM